MKRRSSLRLLGVGTWSSLLAGCSGRLRPPPAPEQTPLPNETVAFPRGPKEPPARPSSLTEDSARVYVKEFEHGYVYNKLWVNEESVVGVTCQIERVEDISAGYKVVVSCQGSSKTEGPGPNATVVYGDWFKTSSVYFIDDSSLIRRRVTE